MKIVVANAETSSTPRSAGIYQHRLRHRRLRRRAVHPAAGVAAVHRRHALTRGRRRGRSPASSETDADRIASRRSCPADLKAKTGTQVRDDDTSRTSPAALSFINYILLGFGIVALLVGTFIIYNTFSMIVAQRQRELALLRAIGAVAQAGAPLGRARGRASSALLGSALGLAGGIGLAYGLHALLDALNLGLPSGGW